MNSTNRDLFPHQKRSDRRTCLYRHFDASDRLLYVGIAYNGVERTESHRSASTWFEQIARITIEHFNSRQSALAAEEKAIIEEKPRYNRKFPANYIPPEMQSTFLIDVPAETKKTTWCLVNKNGAMAGDPLDVIGIQINEPDGTSYCMRWRWSVIGMCGFAAGEAP